MNKLTNKWEPRVITVPDDLNTNFEITPDKIPVLIRSNYMIENSVRPVILVNMPVVYK